jgi:hypothetical protein
MATVTYQHGAEESRTSKSRKWCGGRVEYGQVTKLGDEESLAVEKEDKG